MAASTELIIAGGLENSIPFVISSLKNAGFKASSTQPGVVKVERGSMGMTLAFGALSGSKFHVSFTFVFRIDEHGNSCFRFDSDGALGAVKGGAIGYAKTKKVFEEAINSIRVAASGNGILLADRQV
ncbi:hypothetical protein [Psychromicrobium sp. YIM B11713]|uniref:hypothetical protein n=1 Tax=Psychromicrobium sp. YIM B11713 TaxID=3145233 RepID=UPI00374EA21C